MADPASPSQNKIPGVGFAGFGSLSAKKILKLELAEVAELAYAQVSEACGSNPMRVRPSPSALFYNKNIISPFHYVQPLFSIHLPIHVSDPFDGGVRLCSDETSCPQRARPDAFEPSGHRPFFAVPDFLSADSKLQFSALSELVAVSVVERRSYFNRFCFKSNRFVEL